MPIQIAAVNPYMGRLAGELCDGLRLHPIATFRFATEKVLPAVAAGAAQGGAQRAEIDVIGAPFLAIAPDAEGVEAAKQALKQHIAFYASTPPTTRCSSSTAGRMSLRSCTSLSREGRWTEMPERISDEMLAEWAIIGTWDELVPKLRARCGGIFSTLLLDLPAALAPTPIACARIVAALHARE